MENVKDYKLIYDYHTHTTYSHGKGSIYDNVRVAHDKGLSGVAITDHGPGHMLYGMKLSDVPKMREEIAFSKKEFPNMEILLGLEANLKYNEPYIDINSEENKMFDIVLLGYHYGVNGAKTLSNYLWNKSHKEGLHYELVDGGYQADMSLLMVNNTSAVINSLNSNRVNILTHPGDKGPFDIYDIAKTCEITKTLLEINLVHNHLNVEELKVCKDFNIKFILSSDAHDPLMVGEYKEQLNRAFLAGISPDRIVNIRRV